MPQANDQFTFTITISSNRVGEGREKDFGDIVATYPGLDYEALIMMQHTIVAGVNETLHQAGLAMLEEAKKGTK